MPTLSTEAWEAFGDVFSDFYGRQFDRILQSLDKADAQIVNDFLCEISTYLLLQRDERAEAEQQAEDKQANENRGGKRANAGQKPFGLTGNERIKK